MDGKNLLRIVFRQSGKRRGYALLNIAGLAVGMASCLLLFEYVAFERRYDSFNPKAERIVRIQDEEYQNGKLIIPCASAMPALKSLLIKDFPEVENACRLYKSSFLLANEAANVRFQETRVYYADSSALNIFDIHLIRGNAQSALADPDKLVLSTTEAKKYFGGEDPLGKTLTIHDGGRLFPLQVTGVFEDYPVNSHISFDMLVSYKTFGRIAGSYGRPNDPMETDWRWTDFYTYVLLKNKTDLAGLKQKLPAFIDKYYNDLPKPSADRDRFKLIAMPLQDIHLYSHFIQEAEPTGNGRSVSFLFLIAFFIIVIAWVNYTNLNAARSLERAREVGVRKVLGAQQQQLIRQFMMESLFFNSFALVVALILAFSCNGLFALLTGRPLGALFSLPMDYWAEFMVVFFIGTILSGFYPAMILSRYQPVRVLKGVFKNSFGGQWVRKSLIIGQFAISIILISGTIVVYRQVNYMRSRDLGADINQTLVLKGAHSMSDSAYRNNFDAFKEDTRSIKGIKTITASSYVMGEEILTSTDWKWMENPHGTRIVETFILGIDDDFVPAYGIRVVAGRNLALSHPSDWRAVLLNESAVRSLGFPSPEAAVGQMVSASTWRLDSFLVVGVVADYHQEGLQKIIQPLLFWRHSDLRARYSLKIATSDVASVIADVKNVWKRHFPDDPFSYFFLDDSFNHQYAEDQQFGTVFGLFAIFAIAIACFGLLGLSAYNVLQRSKEISIRKVLGASVPALLYLLSADFLVLVAVALVIAVPLSWIVMDKWLQNFATRIGISWWIFGLSGFLALTVAFLTVAGQAWKAAMTNPVKNLRSE
jgi:putative ABC transport system permease protein